MTTFFRIAVIGSLLALAGCNSTSGAPTSAAHLTQASPGAANPEVGPDGTVRRLTTAR